MGGREQSNLAILLRITTGFASYCKELEGNRETSGNSSHLLSNKIKLWLLERLPGAGSGETLGKTVHVLQTRYALA